MAITATEKKQLKKEIVAELKAEASDVLQLEEVTSLAGVRSFPAVRGENPVSVPLSLLDFSPAINKKVDKVAGKGLSTEDFTTAEKQKLAGIAAGANNYTHPASHPASMIATDETHLFVTAAEKSVWNAKAAATVATQSAMGLMSAADKTKLDSIAAGANAYTHPASHPASMIAQDTTHRFVTDAEKTTWTGKASTAVATQAANGLLSAADKKKLDGIAAGANNYTHPASHPATMIAQDTTHRFVTDAEKAEWNSKTGILSALHSVSYAELVALRNGKQLRPGHHYRITDFVTTVGDDDEARSAGHPFDIIVLATADDTLSEEARAIVNERNAAYFATANLDAWKVWYCLDNDTTRFQWADEANGRGVIYRLIDEWQNDCPYDFKNIQFKRYRAVDESPSGQLRALNGLYIGINAEMQYLSIEAYDFIWAYTFSFGDRRSAPTDASLIGFNTSDLGEGYGNKGHYGNNVILPCTCHVTIDNEQNAVFCLNNIVWFADNVQHQVLMNGTRIDGECVNMTLSGYGTHVMFDCRGIITGDGGYANTFGVGCASITLGSYCSNNTFGKGCCYNTFGNYCSDNTFGNYCVSNSFGNYCVSNSFGNDCGWNTFGNYCNKNTFGNDCGWNTFGNYCVSNSFGNYLSYMTVNDGVKYVAVVGGTTSNPMRNAQILNGTSGQNHSNRLQISFKANVKYCQFAGLNSSGILKIWTPADLA